MGSLAVYGEEEVTIDSIYEVPDGDEDSVGAPVKRNIDELSRIDDLPADATGHGTRVANILTSTDVNLELVFYRVTQDVSIGEGSRIRAHKSDICNAFYKAIDIHDIDLINISLGTDHSEEGEICESYRDPCKLRQSANEAVESGIPVCAAAGNASSCSGMCCPAYGQDVISVGGVDPICTTRINANDPITPVAESRPPMAGWVDSPKSDVDAVLCTGGQCAPDCACSSNRELSEWEGNVPLENHSPDVYAPHTSVSLRWSTRSECRHKLGYSSSNASPIASAFDHESGRRTLGRQSASENCY